MPRNDERRALARMRAYRSRHTFAKISLPDYTTPARKDMAVVIPFFNPTQSIRLVQNILTTTTLLHKANIPFFLIELASETIPFVFSESPTIFQYRASSFMFYKENLFAVAEQRISPEYTKLMLLDSDILFENKDWYDRVSSALDTLQVVQAFGVAHYLEFDFQSAETKHSVLIPDITDPHTGFAWAFRRDWYARAHIFELALIGGGDTIFNCQIQKKDLKSTYSAYMEDYKSMSESGTTETSIGYVDNTIYHLYHGPSVSRQYGSRHDDLWRFLRSKKITRLSDLVERREDGIFEWIPAYRDECNALLLKYFYARNDDS